MQRFFLFVLELLGGLSELEPPDSIPNSVVKQLSADNSVALPCEGRSPPRLFLIANPRRNAYWGFVFYSISFFIDLLYIPSLVL